MEAGAVKLTEISRVCPGLTVPDKACEDGPLMEFPSENTIAKEVVHEQVPTFLSRQVFVKAAPGATTVPSG